MVNQLHWHIEIKFFHIYLVIFFLYFMLPDLPNLTNITGLMNIRDSRKNKIQQGIQSVSHAFQREKQHGDFDFLPACITLNSKGFPKGLFYHFFLDFWNINCVVFLIFSHVILSIVEIERR